MAGLGTPSAGAQPQGGEEEYQSPTSMFDESAMEMEEPTPEEQAQFEQFERAMMGYVYANGQVSPQIIDNLKGNFDPSVLEMFAEAQPALTDSPQDSLAATGVMLTLLTEENAQEQTYSDDVVLHGGKRAIEELIEVAEAAKIHEFSEQDMETVTYRAFDLYRIASPRVDPEALTAEFQMLAEASNQGNLGAVLPGLPGGAPMKPQQGAS